MACVDIIRTFPANTGCLIVKDNKNTMVKKDRYLGGYLSPFYKRKSVVLLRLNTDIEMDTFATWWVNDLDFGSNPFRIDLPYFGVTKTHVVRMLNDLVDNNTGDGVREIVLDLELEYDGLQ